MNNNFEQVVADKASTLKDYVGLALSKAECVTFVKEVIDAFMVKGFDATHKFTSFKEDENGVQVVLQTYHKSLYDAQEYAEEYLKGIAEIRNRDFGISTKISEL
ncbi:MAG: hypothetical protein HRT87_04530 [Legionellales bacterium]|nr:hypothetical protein [Legionellales bacterium]